MISSYTDVAKEAIANHSGNDASITNSSTTTNNDLPTSSIAPNYESNINITVSNNKIVKIIQKFPEIDYEDYPFPVEIKTILDVIIMNIF